MTARHIQPGEYHRDLLTEEQWAGLLYVFTSLQRKAARLIVEEAQRIKEQSECPNRTR